MSHQPSAMSQTNSSSDLLRRGATHFWWSYPRIYSYKWCSFLIPKCIAPG